MLEDVYQPIRELRDGELLGAKSWLDPLAANQNLLYGVAHGWYYPFSQRWGQQIGPDQPIWEGETPQRSDHPTLNFTARLDLSDGCVAHLVYLRQDDTWGVLGSETVTTTARYFGNANPWQHDLSVYTGNAAPKDGVWRLKFYTTGGFAVVCRAYLSGTVGWPAWPVMPTFAGAPTVHTASDFNALRTAIEYLRYAALKPHLGTVANVANLNGIGPLFRSSFVYGPCTRLYVHLAATTAVSNWGSIRLIKEAGAVPGDCCWAGWGETAGEVDLQVLTGSFNATLFAFNLSAHGLTVGGRYGIEIRTNGNPIVSLLGLGFGDEAGVIRTWTPIRSWTHGERPGRADLSNNVDDLEEMYWLKSPIGESPLWPWHDFATYQWPVTVQGDGVYGPTGYYLAHRWRWLRWRGAGRIQSLDGTRSYSLSDSDPPGQAQLMDLDLLAWLVYGDGYYVVTYPTQGEQSPLMVAYEDYIGT